MKRLFTMSAFVIATALFFASCGGNEATTTDDATAPEVTEETTAPAEEVPAEEVAPAEEAAPEAAAFDLEAGKATYDAKCSACHIPGVGPKLDNTAAWEAIAAQGLETIYTHSIEGFTGETGTMPPKGGFADLTDDDMHNAIAYMLETAGVTAE